MWPTLSMHISSTGWCLVIPEIKNKPAVKRSAGRKSSKTDVRTQAVRVIEQVMGHHRSLSAVLPQFQDLVADRDRALLQELSYGTLRWYGYLQAIAAELLNKPLKSRDQDIFYLVLVGLYQLIYMRIPAHAVVDETVSVTDRLNKRWAKGLVNAVLRSWQRGHTDIEARLLHNQTALSSHPDWLLEMLQAAWPEQWQQIVQANNERPPMTLRINQQRISRDDYLRTLRDSNTSAQVTRFAHAGITLDSPQDVFSLPGFSDGEVSVQDEAAQLATECLDPQPGDRVLDACAAPGGKGMHVLESQPALQQLVALDVDKARTQRVHENLHRLQLQAEVVCADAVRPDTWWDGELFDRILLDAPCSASGVIRRHPDIKWLRQAQDIQKLQKLQQAILVAIWPLLKPGGILLYVTCSVSPEENSEQIKQFLAHTPDAHENKIEVAWGHACEYGRQVLPGEDRMDGFYYARLVKQ